MKRKPNGQFALGSHWREHQRFREFDYLSVEYTEKKRSAGEIAAEWGVTENAIFYWLAKLEIPRRAMREIRKEKYWGLSGEVNGMHGRTGVANPRFVDGSSPERQRMYARSFWKVLAVHVLVRDDYKCQRCGRSKAKGNPLHAHHITPWAGNADLRFELTNITTVCKLCHNWIHSNANTLGDFLKQ